MRRIMTELPPLFAPPPACTQVSVVVPAQNEDENVVPLIEEIDRALSGFIAFEMVFVDDGSTDATWARLQEARKRFANLVILRHAKGAGQSVAIRSGVKAAQYPWIATLDGDGQNDPADIPALIKALNALPQGAKPAMMAGQRAKRRDTWFRRFSSRVANGVRRALLNDDTPDTGCGLKLFPRQMFLDMAHFNHLHRFLCAMMIRQGGQVISVPVNHRPRERGVSKYGLWNRLWVGIVDLFGVMWLMKRPVAPKVTEVEGR
jgi:dolichol-phosphate mannosyltransferase